MPLSADTPWYDRFFREEYLAFDEHPNTDLEVEFLLDTLHLDSHTRLLDLGCGYGRHAVPLARTSPVTGLDRSPVMLSAARRNARDAGVVLNLVRGDMRDLPFTEAFDVATSLFSSLGYFDNDDENFLVLQAIASVLRPGGRFLVESVNREFLIRHSLPHQVYHPNGMLVVEEREFNPVTGRSHVDVTVVRDGKETRLHHSIRVFAFTELDMLLTAAGFQTLDVWGDFMGADYDCDSEHTIVLAEKA